MYMYRYVVTFCLSGCPDVGLNLFFFNDAKLTEYYTLSLHDALPIYRHVGRTRDLGLRGGHGQVAPGRDRHEVDARRRAGVAQPRSEEHTSELQSRENLVCRLLLEKKNIKK